MRKVKEGISAVGSGIKLAASIVPMMTIAAFEWAKDSYRRGREINRILKKLPDNITEEERTYLLSDILYELEQYYIDEVFYDHETQNLYYRLHKMKERLEKGELSEIDVQLIRYIYDKEDIENIPYKVKGKISFQLKEPYLSLLEYRVKNHFFMKHFVKMESESELLISDWQRQKDELMDLIVFIHEKGTLTDIDLEFPYDEYGFDRLKVAEGKLFGILKGERKAEISYEKGYLMSMNINTEEKRKIKLMGTIMVPLMKEFMGQEYDWNEKKYIMKEKTVLLETGEWASPCTQCVFRARQISNSGCSDCKPKLAK